MTHRFLKRYDSPYFTSCFNFQLSKFLVACNFLLKIDTTHQSEDGLLRDFCDGETFRKHPLFSMCPKALQLMIFYDDLKVCNPLGSKSTIHKLGKQK